MSPKTLLVAIAVGLIVIGVTTLFVVSCLACVNEIEPRHIGKYELLRELPSRFVPRFMSKHISKDYQGPIVVKPNIGSFGGQNVHHCKSMDELQAKIEAKQIQFDTNNILVQSLERLAFEVRLDLVRDSTGHWQIRHALRCPFTEDKFGSVRLDPSALDPHLVQQLFDGLPRYLNAITIDGTMNEDLNQLIIYEINGAWGLPNHFLRGPRMQWSRFLFGDLVDWLRSRVPIGYRRLNWKQPWTDVIEYIRTKRARRT